MKPLRLVLGVSVAWTAVAVIVGVQASLGSTLMGASPMPMANALRTAFIQTLPWIPVTLAAIALTIRVPLGRGSWRNVLVHVPAALVLTFVANVLVVSGFWAVSGQFQGIGALVRAGALWATIRLHLAMLIYGAILGITQTVLYQRRARARELHVARIEGQLARAQVQALNAQIRPHFLFNTLHTIGQLWRTGRHEDADSVLDSLGTLFHKVQTSTSSVAIPLSEELEMVRQYLAIEQVRYRDRLRATIEVPDQLLDCPVPPLILQPIVENAVRHGIAAVSRAGRLDVTVSRENGVLRLSVRDDGPGPASAPPTAGTGVGLSNTRERLGQLYGDRAALKLLEAPGGGTLVTIDIPVSGSPAQREDAP
jgi:two-component system LytT family sensor kinase